MTTNNPHTFADIYLFLQKIRSNGFVPRGILDVGANQGAWTKMAASIWPNSQILMIEPQEEMQPILEQLCRSNRLLNFIKAGAGRKSGHLIQTIWKDLAGSSFLPSVSEDKMRDGTQRVTKIVTIDEAVRTQPDFIPDLVKLDIQGFELEALRGAQSLFGVTEIFILETSLYEFLPRQPITLNCLEFMHDRGYDLFDITGFLHRPLDGALAQIDLAFAKNGGFFRNSNRWS